MGNHLFIDQICPFFTNIEHDTLENEDYRRVLYTDRQMQLVLMTLKPGETIPLESHDDTTQFIRVEHGIAHVQWIREEDGTVIGRQLEDGDVVIIPAGTDHFIENVNEDMDLKLYTIYTPPEHQPETILERPTNLTFNTMIKIKE